MYDSTYTSGQIHKTESRMVTARRQKEVAMGSCLMGMQFQFEKMKCSGDGCGYIHNNEMYLMMVNWTLRYGLIVYVMLCLFYCNFKKLT